MDEGNCLMKSRGWQKKSMFVWMAMAFCGVFSAEAAPLGVRDIQIGEGGGARVLLDGVPGKGAIQIDYVRDIVQFSLQNTTIYPAKILHADPSKDFPFSKVFAYQYAPNLVRFRFTVEGKAESYKGKVGFELNGKEMLISFPKEKPVRAEELSEKEEQSLLSKVLGNEEKKKEDEVKAAPEPMKSGKGKVRLGAAAKPVELGGRTHGPSVFRSLFAMFLIVGGLGLVLLYVKKKAGASQAKRVGDSWLSGILPGSRKSKAFIEVIANHSIGPKQSITIVRIKDQQFVLGVTPDSVQLITQLDSEEADLDLLEDPKVADSIGKMFGSKVKSESKSEPKIGPAVNFDSILKSSSGVGAIVARNAYQSQSEVGTVVPMNSSPITVASRGVREQIRKRLQQSAGSVE